MTIPKRVMTLGVLSVVALAGCVSDGPEEATTDATEPETEISVTVPAERLTPFCQAMIDLTDRLRSGDEDLGADAIVETYRSIRADVPGEIASDFDAVLDALESGAPPPTDPPPETFATVPATVATSDLQVDSSTPSTSSEQGEVSVDEGFAAGTTPGERVNDYVSFACRDTQNNPGPQATQPLENEPTDEG